MTRTRKIIEDPADALYMERVLELAAEGLALASPNPCVGAIVVNDAGEIIGEGFHTYDGRKHAEVLALEDACAEAAGSTLYLNLEPCCHTGRTAPCTDAVIAAGIRRVVASMADPNPLVAGKGFERLRAAGIEVEIGVGAEQARRLNESFAKYIRTKLPFVTLKTAMTLDGKIAPPPTVSGNPTALGAAEAARGWITSEPARAHVHELRHRSDAILVGVGTIIADDPLLTDRTDLPRRRPLMRVVLDSGLRIPLNSRVVKTAHNDLIVFCSHAHADKVGELQSVGVSVERVAANADGRPDLTQVMTRLGAMQITSVLIEGGSIINWESIESGIVDKLFFYYAPRILGGTGAVPFSTGKGFHTISDSLQATVIELHTFGQDFAVEAYLRDPYGQKGIS